MARYIDLDAVEFLKVDGNEEFNHGVDCCINKLLEIEPADVTERSKINRVIEELCEKVKNRGFLSCESDYIQREIRSIFKRNIGE